MCRDSANDEVSFVFSLSFSLSSRFDQIPRLKKERGLKKGRGNGNFSSAAVNNPGGLYYAGLVKERVYDNDIRPTGDVRMTFGPSKRHEATRYVTERGPEGGKNMETAYRRAPPHSEGEGAGSFLPASSSPCIPRFAFVSLLTASLIKSLRVFSERSLSSFSSSFTRFLPPHLSLFSSHPPSLSIRERPWPLRDAEIAVLRLARDEPDSLVNHPAF